MNNYESFKGEFVLELTNLISDIPYDKLQKVLTAMDIASQKYNIELKTMDLITTDEKSNTIVKMFIAAKAVEGKADGTLQMYYRVLNNFFKALRVPYDIVTTNDLRVYLFNYQQTRHVKNATLDSIRLVLLNFFTWCCDEEYLQRNPAKRLGRYKQEQSGRHAMDPIELEYMRKACKTLKEKAIVDFLYSTGCRVAELCSCTKDDIDLVKRTVFIAHGKGNKSRTTFLNPEAVVSLKAYLASRNDNSIYLFTHDRRLKGDGKLSNKAVEDMIRKISNRLQDQIQTHITPHVFRHTAVTVAIHNGMPIEQAKAFAGHSNLNTTMGYTTIKPDDVQKSHERYLT